MENQTLALIASFIAMMLVVCSYFTRKKERFLLFQSLCIVFLIVSYFFTAQFFAMVGLAVGLLRAIVYYAYEKRGQAAPLWVPIVLVLLTAASYFIVNFGILKTSEPLDVLCLVTLLGYIFVFRIRNLKLVRFLMLLPISLSLLYNLLSGAALFASLSYAFELCANVASIIKYHVIGEGRLRRKQRPPNDQSV